MKKKTYLAIAIFLVFVILLVGFLLLLKNPTKNTTGNIVQENKQLAQGTSVKQIKIGVIAPLTGTAAVYGTDIVNMLHLEQHDGVQFIVEDGKCEGKAAVDAVHKLIEVDNVDFIIGGTCSAETLSAAPIAQENKILMISPASTNPKITTAGDYIFRIIPSDTYQAKISATLAKDIFQAENVAVIYCESDFCDGLFQEFKKDYSGNIVAQEKFPNNNADFRTQITKALNKNPDVLFVIAYPEDYKKFFKQYLELNGNKPILGPDTLNDPEVFAQEYFNDYPVKVVFAFPENNWKDSNVVKRYKEKYHADFTPYAPYAYDILHMLLYATEQTDSTDSTTIKTFLNNMPEYDGLTGKIQFDNNGDIMDATFEMYEIKNNSAVVVQVIE